MKRLIIVTASLLILVLALGAGWGALSTLHVPHSVSKFFLKNADSWWISEPGVNPVLQVCGPDDRT